MSDGPRFTVLQADTENVVFYVNGTKVYQSNYDDLRQAGMDAVDDMFVVIANVLGVEIERFE